MNIQSILILIAIVAIFGIIVYRMLTRKQKCCSCAGCSLADTCNKQTINQQKQL